MKGLNTKTRYQTKVLLAIASLALFYNSSGWSFVMSVCSLAWMIHKSKKESIKNIYWMILSGISSIGSFGLLVTSIIYKNDDTGKRTLIQQFLAAILVASIVSSSILSEEKRIIDDEEDSDDDDDDKLANKKKKKKPSTITPPTTIAFTTTATDKVKNQQKIQNQSKLARI